MSAKRRAGNVVRELRQLGGESHSVQNQYYEARWASHFDISLWHLSGCLKEMLRYAHEVEELEVVPRVKF
jgi:hypothetical protein